MATNKRVFDKDLNVEIASDEDEEQQKANNSRTEHDAGRGRKRAKFDGSQSGSVHSRLGPMPSSTNSANSATTLTSNKITSNTSFSTSTTNKQASSQLLSQRASTLSSQASVKAQPNEWYKNSQLEDTSGSENYEDIDYGDDDDDGYDGDQAKNTNQKNEGLSSGRHSFNQDTDDEPENKHRRRRGQKVENDDVDDGEMNQSGDAVDSGEGERDNDDEQAGQGEKQAEKCKYWPACNAGASCAYYHPTKPCRAFPNCRFGRKCLFIHPTCKYNPNCAKPNCPFAHPAGSAIVAPAASRRPAFYRGNQQPLAPKCKFGSNCMNRACQFTHTRNEPCRFGSNCLLDSCPFTHPSDSKRPGSSVFKWSAQS